MIIPFKFVEWEEGEKIEIKNPKDFLNKLFSCSRFAFGLDNITRFGIYKLHGWAYDFKPYLRKFVYQQYGNWQQIYAPNKTILRGYVGGRINKILEVI